MRILIAFDGSECSMTAVKSILAREWPSDTKCCVFMVVESESSNLYQESVDASVLQLAPKFGSHNVSAKVVDVYRSVADSIVHEARKWPADLIVLGSHGRKGFQKFVLGSVAEKVANHAPCSVEIVKERPLHPTARPRRSHTSRTYAGLA